MALDDLIGIALYRRPIAISPRVDERLAATRSALEAVASAPDARPHYGINTGFGSFSRQRIDRSELAELQRNLVRSHAAGAGEPLDTPSVRGMLALLVASLARGHSGVRPVIARALAGMLNAGVTPVVPELGSVGASGDLAPLAHAAQVLIGEGMATLPGDPTPMAGARALRSAGIEPLTLEAKEGLALINGTHLMAARLALVVHGLGRLIPAACLAAAMSIDACRATDAFLDARVYTARNHPGPARVASRLRELLAGSTILPSHATPDDPRVQDPYSIRCAPIVLGAALTLAEQASAALAHELGAVTDNPLVLSNAAGGIDIVSAGNFHGMPVAVPLDTAAIACAHVAGVSERRLYHMISAVDPLSGLRPFLSPKPGLHSGYMVTQYTAAACCNELIGLATPASVSNIPTCAGMEDYNSFGPRAAAKALRAVELARRVVAIELLCAAQGVESHRPLRSGDGVEAAIGIIRRSVRPLDADRSPSPDIASIESLVRDGDFMGICPGLSDGA